MKIQPLGDRVLLQLDPVEEKKIQSIIIPGRHSEPVRLATVMAVGPEVTNFEVGNRVLISYMAGLVIDNPELNDSKALWDTVRIVCQGEIPAKVEV